MKRIYRIALTAAASVSLLSGCALAEAGNSDDQITVGLAVANQQAPFFNQIRTSVQEVAKKKGVEVILADAGGDANRQVSQIQDFITRDVDAIIYIPAGATAASVPVRDAHEADIPVVTVDRNPEEVPGDTFIASDSVAAAKELGEWVVKQTDGKGNLAHIRGQIGTTPEIARSKGFAKAIEGTDIEVVAKQASDAWHQDEGFNIAQDMLQSNPDIDIFFGHADALALGAAAAARAAGYSRDDLLIVGFDGDPEALEALKDGVIDATMTQQTNLMGKLALESAVKLANGEDLPEQQLQDAVLTTEDNVQKFIENHP